MRTDFTHWDEYQGGLWWFRKDPIRWEYVIYWGA